MFVSRLNSFLSNVTTRLYKEDSYEIRLWNKNDSRTKDGI